MKKTITWLLSALMLVSVLAGTCAPPALAATDVYSPEGSVIFDKDGVKVTTAGLDRDPTEENVKPIIWVEIENSTEQDVYLGVADAAVNGVMTDAYLIDFYEEDGQYYGGDYLFTLTVPAQSSSRHALGYAGNPCVNLEALSKLEFCFTIAEDEYTWPDYKSDPVTIATGEKAETPDVGLHGTVVLDNEALRLTIGEQDYDEWFGPNICVYVENRTNHYIGIMAETAEADGVFCDYMYYNVVVAPGKLNANMLSFDGEIRELKGFENLTLNCKLYEAENSDELNSENAVVLDPITVTYPPQVWGEYENEGLNLEIMPKYNKLITVETPADSTEGILFSVSETASLEAGSFEGAGWLFSIGKISEERLHEMLCQDMSGAIVFAKDETGNYFVLYHPTDVRFERATVEEMQNDVAQWTMLNEWANNVPEQFADKNGLERVGFGNSELDIYVARAAWMDNVDVTLSTTEFGPVEAKNVDGTPYAEHVLQGYFWETDLAETPDGEYVVLNFPEENVRLDFFFAPGAYARVVSGEHERLYQAGWYDDDYSYADSMQEWYYAAAELAGVKPAAGS